jgi:alanine racemase
VSRLLLPDSSSVVEVDLEAVADNTRHIRSLVNNDCQLYAALKCDAYGLGLVPVAHTILGSGGDAIAVARAGDALALRQAGIRAPILLYPSQLMSAGLVNMLEEQGITPAVADADAARALSRHARRRMPVFLKIDVGLRRLGVAPEEAQDVATLIRRLPRLNLDGVITHMHVPADPVPEGYLEWQYQRFARVLDQLAAERFQVRVRMAASSAVLRLTGTMNLTAVDPGRLFLGLIGAGPSTADRPWSQALSAFKSRLIVVKDVPADEFSDIAQISVGRGIRLGIFPLGSADGLRVASAGHVLVRGQRAPVLNIALEHCRVDLSDGPNAAVGDDVVIIGRQGDDEITLDEVSRFRGVAPGRLRQHRVFRVAPQPGGRSHPRSYDRPDRSGPNPLTLSRDSHPSMATARPLAMKGALRD